VSEALDGGRLAAALDFVFADFEHKRTTQAGRLDREVRRPELVIEIARRRGWLPDAAATVLVTGSKGKGSTARLLAWGLGHAGAGPVGLLLSPEEREHTDRIRIDNQPIAAGDFADIVESLREDVRALQAQAPEHYYVPPTALFLLVALAWFHRQGVRHVVLEGGRGARWDEIGPLQARLGVVTSVLPEHLDKLGPTVADVAADKLSLAAHCAQVLVGPTVWPWAQRLLPDDQRARVAAVDAPPHDWYALAHALAEQACARLLGAPCALPRWNVPSFAQERWRSTPDGRACDCEVLLDGAVVPECLAPRLAQPSLRRPAAVVLGVSDDKDVDGLVAQVLACPGWSLYVVELHARSGHLRSARALQVLQAGQGRALGRMEIVSGDWPGASELVSELLCSHRTVAFVGVQTFLRSVRQVLGLGRSGPDAPAPAGPAAAD
jgi:dihydrofolate synthase/folylpolyglutamate synthase